MQRIRAKVLIENPTEEEFRLVRQTLVTGTDISTILNLNPWSTRYSLALEKKGLVPPREMNDEMWVGKQLEPTILALFERKMNRRVRPNKAIVVDPENEWAGGTPDAFTDDDGPVEGIEAKAVGTRAAAHWGEPGTEDVPVFYWTQCSWYSGICAIPWNLIGLMGTKGQVHPINPPADSYPGMLEAAREFREKYMLADALPDPEASDIPMVAKLFPKSEEAELMETPEIRDLAVALAKAKVEKEVAETLEKSAKAKLMALMGEKQRIRGGDFSISWKNNKPSSKTNYEAAFDKAIQRLPQKYADELIKIVDESTLTVPGARVFRTFGSLFKEDA